MPHARPGTGRLLLYLVLSWFCFLLTLPPHYPAVSEAETEFALRPAPLPILLLPLLYSIVSQAVSVGNPLSPESRLLGRSTENCALSSTSFPQAKEIVPTFSSQTLTFHRFILLSLALCLLHPTRAPSAADVASRLRHPLPCTSFPLPQTFL